MCTTSSSSQSIASVSQVDNESESKIKSKKSKPKPKEKDSPYRQTVNLPQTTFEQRANAVQREPEIQNLWKSSQVYEQLSRKNPGEKFILHDGPPYANGGLHMGHALNKVLKDFINRYQLLKGRRATFVPGWDCHGLPIELKVLQSKKNSKSLSPLELRKVAGEFAKETVEDQKSAFQRLGVWADWDTPYLTLQKEYEAAQIGVFGDMLLRGHIYRGLKPVHWSPSSRTALAEAELEYPEGHVSRSVYAAFRVASSSRSENATISDAIQSEHGISLSVWTTTPWTMPANLAVAVNPDLEYSVVKVLSKQGEEKSGQREWLVVAQGLVENVAQKMERKLEIVTTVKGSELVGLEYMHPVRRDVLCRVVVGGDYITTESGTGLVHTAPGHGQEDYIVGMREGLGMISPVDDAGKFTSEAADGSLEGLPVLTTGNEACIKMLQENGRLLLEEPYSHKYPYDWRTKKPTIFRSTEQWFASVEGFRDSALDQITNGVSWVPASGEKRIYNMVSGRADWCISRQRVWGVPIPVFYDAETKESIMDDEIIRAVQALFLEKGSNAWFELEADEILPEKYRGRGLVKGTDTMDVWFDSGCSWAAVAAAREELAYPVDIYLEGSDQHRGWFQSSLLTSVAVKGQAPYKQVVTHGFVLDEKGLKMSKSIGNVIDPKKVIEGGPNQKIDPPYGADVLRLWVASVDYSGDVLVGPNILKQVADTYRKLRNTVRYLIGNIHDFDFETNGVSYEQLPSLDKYILNSLRRLADEVEASYESYTFLRVYQSLQRFAIIDLSNFYLDIAKDRLYICATNDIRRRSCQTVLYWLLRDMTTLMAPILPHMAEDIWQNIPEGVKGSQSGSVFEQGWISQSLPYREPIPEDVESNWTLIRSARDVVNRCFELARTEKTIGASLDAKVRIYSPNASMLTALSQLESGTLGSSTAVDALSTVFIASEVQIVSSKEEIEAYAHTLTENSDADANTKGMMVGVDRADGLKCERCWCYDTSVGSVDQHPSLCARCGSAV